MPRYFFNVYDGRDLFDEKGTELQSTKEMRFYMLTMATEMLLNAELQKDTWQMEVLDEGRQNYSLNEFWCRGKMAFSSWRQNIKVWKK